jgi:uncharacterized RDD family membrane protein YckC
MKCHGCGHDYPNTISRCPRCRLSSRRGSKSTDSRLIEFPRKARTTLQSEPAEASLPAWRVELNERVRAIKAKRGSEPDTLSSSIEESNEIERGPVAVRQEEVRSRVRAATGRDLPTITPAEAARDEFNPPGSSYQPAQPSRSTGRANTSIVEAALTRVRRASENASRAALPKIEPARPVQPSATGALALDREATARVLEPAAEIKPRPAPRTIPLPEISQPPVERPAPVEVASSAVAHSASPSVVEKVDVKHSIHPGDSFAPVASSPVGSSKILVLDEIEPMDYLEAEIRKVDKVLSKEFAKNDSPSLGTHLVLNIIDLLTIAVSSSPFVAIILITNGSLASFQTRVAVCLMIALVTFLYFALTQCLCGKTFGMMFTGTHILEARTSEPPSAQRALLRSAGYFIAAAPALLGLLWSAFDRKRRGWQDIIAGTFVASDF